MKHYTQLFFLFFFLTFPYSLYAQLSEGGEPESFKRSSQIAIPYIEMAPFDAAALLREDSLAAANGERRLRFAKSFDTHFSSQMHGAWEVFDNGDKIWYLGIRSLGAYSLNVIFKRFKLPEGGKLFIYNQSREQVLGAFTHKNNPDEDAPFAVAPVAGESIIIEYFEPAEAQFPAQLEIGQIAHDYRGIFGSVTEKDSAAPESEFCQIDVLCPDGDNWRTERHAICRIIIQGIYLCTGALVNNVRQDGTPYFLTANHCVESQDDAASLVFYFNYESPVCDGPDGDDSQTMSGATMRATVPMIDFALVEINEEVPVYFTPYFAGWNATNEHDAIYYVNIHHPAGDVKKINMSVTKPITATWTGQEDYDEDTHWRIATWLTGATEGGSSGSPLFDGEKQVIGDLTGGASSCSNPYNDYFSKVSSAWENYPLDSQQLKVWLDPDDTGTLTLSGYDPYNVDIEEIKHTENRFMLVPNPGTTECMVDCGEMTGQKTIELFDILGNMIVTKKTTQQTVHLDLAQLPAGVYFVSVINNNTRTTQRLLVTK